jgi:hypothetical protein
MEVPLLRIGLLGFDSQQSQRASVRIASAVSNRARWEVVPFEDADMWLIHSPSASAVEQRGLRISNPGDAGSALTIYPHQTSRPVAFTLPLPDTIDAMLRIDLEDMYQCVHDLNTFAAALPNLCAHFALGEQVAVRQTNLEASTYHLNFEGKLIAVVDLANWRVSLQPGAKPIELSLASWRHRPLDNVQAPAGFEVLALDRLMWTFSSRTLTPSLPDAYHTSTIYLRRLSTLPQSWLHRDHMNLISYLNKQPQTLAQLQQVTQLSAERLVACLSALYYSGTITTNAALVQHRDKRAGPASQASLGETVKLAADDSQGFGRSSSSIFDTYQAPAVAK